MNKFYPHLKNRSKLALLVQEIIRGAYLDPLAERLGIRVRLDQKLPAVMETRKGMSKFFGRGR